MPIILSPTSEISLVSPLLVTTITSTEQIPHTILPTSININYTKPTISIYKNLNADPRVHQRLVKYFYYKALDKWLYEDLIDILNYLKIRNGKVDIINSMKEYDPLAVDKESDDDIRKKIDFIEKFFLSKRLMARIIHEYVKHTGTNWVDLPKNEYFIRQIVGNKLTRRIKRAIAEREQLSKKEIRQ